MAGLGVASGSWKPFGCGALRACRICSFSVGLGKVMSSCNGLTVRMDVDAHDDTEDDLTSNDCAYQCLTLVIDGIPLRLCGSSSSSLTLCANRTGSSSGGC